MGSGTIHARIGSIWRESPGSVCSAEWKGGTERLATIVGHPVEIASVPAGYNSCRVAEAAAEAGIETLLPQNPLRER
jgi:hypothetical protein